MTNPAPRNQAVHHQNMKTALIIGAGPAGLTAAAELLERTEIRPVVLEKSREMGGLSRTVKYKGNCIDIGGHRFFSKSDRVMAWWLKRLPLQRLPDELRDTTITYQNQTRSVLGLAAAPDPEATSRVMLLRQRRTRIYWRRKFFTYPIALSPDTLKKLGAWRVWCIGWSYLRSVLRPISPEQTLEEFFINRFGRELYRIFFRSYTEKVWGVLCSEISADWGAQRIKGLSIGKSITHFMRKLLGRHSRDIAQKDTETSLIERFLYPKFGPGQMWETVAEEVESGGGRIECDWNVTGIIVENNRVLAMRAMNSIGEEREWFAEYFFSTMPIQGLVRALETRTGICPVPAAIRDISEGLVYRDFITVGLLLDKLEMKGGSHTRGTHRKLIEDTWIYIQEPDVQVGRMQIFNNWSPYLLADQSKVWLGLEYFCFENDALWSLDDESMIALATSEMQHIGLIDPADVRDATVIRVPKTYPAYFGSYNKFPLLREYLDTFENLFLIGRNGMHKYNNQDHSMLTAMTAVDNIIVGRTDKSNIWAVNTEQDYHEEHSS
jgi:protoporphyrinogen oxidase